MNPPNIRIEYGVLDDVLGVAVAHAGMMFVPATIRLNGYENGAPLEEFAQHCDHATRTLIRPGEDAPWVSGRIQRLFRQPQASADERLEKSCIGFSFVALLAEADGHLGIPFHCTDYYGRSRVLYSDSPVPPPALRQQIAEAFWSLLLQDPTELNDYHDTLCHHGAGVDIAFGVKDGEPFFH